MKYNLRLIPGIDNVLHFPKGHQLRQTVIMRRGENTASDAAAFLAAVRNEFQKQDISVHIDQSWVQLGNVHEKRASGSSVDDMCTTDVLPGNTGKGTATTWLRARLGFEERSTMVAGDGANDIPMFWGAGNERGTIVGNAEALLVAEHRKVPREGHYLASGFFADGVLEGLRHHFQPQEHRASKL